MLLSFCLSLFAPALAQSGGPDAYGYSYSSTAYDYRTLTGAGVPLADDGEWPVTLPWSFPFYGVDYDELTIGANGAVSFGGGQAIGYSNACIPRNGPSDPDIAVFWDDLDPSSGGEVRTWHDASVFIVSWDAVPHALTSGAVSVQLHLYADGRIEMHYADTHFGNPSYDGGRSATIGIQDNATGGSMSGDALSVSCNGIQWTPSGGSAIAFDLGSVPPPSSDDTDGDGDVDSIDCAPTNPAIYTGAPEIADDGIDQDCSGTDTITCWGDFDLDGHGVVFASLLAADGDCNDPGEAWTANDCNDSDPNVHPGALESCDAIDSDCDGSIVDWFDDIDIDGTPDCIDWDADGDGHPSSTDCDDTSPHTFPGAPEACDTVDSDCDGSLLDDAAVDLDGDGFPECSGDTDGDGVEDALDCAPLDASIYTGAAEVPEDGVDQDCNGFDTVRCYVDDDYDGYGSAWVVLDPFGSCGVGRSLFSGDCDDDDSTIHPFAAELCDIVDADCDGDLVDHFSDKDLDLTPDCIDPDADGDGWNAGDDCNDDDATIYPDAPEACDARDSNCDGDLVDIFVDADLDGVPECTGSDLDGDGDADLTDCAPLDASIHHGSAEIVDDGIDQDCSGADTVTCYVDLDGDGHGLSTDIFFAADGNCTDPGEAATGDDCNDNDDAVWPGAPEACDKFDTDCDGSMADTFPDLDADGRPDCVDGDIDGDGVANHNDCASTDPTISTSCGTPSDDDTDDTDDIDDIDDGDETDDDEENGSGKQADDTDDHDATVADKEQPRSCSSTGSVSGSLAGWLGLLGLVSLGARRR